MFRGDFFTPKLPLNTTKVSLGAQFAPTTLPRQWTIQFNQENTIYSYADCLQTELLSVFSLGTNLIMLRLNL